MTCRIVLIEDLAAPHAAEAAEHVGPLGGWLDERLPGWRTSARPVFVRRANGEEIARDDDPERIARLTPDEGEIVSVLVLPADPVTIGITIAINLAISLALTALSSILFPPPEQPAFEKAPKAGTVFASSVPPNPNRRHEPLPILYGALTYTLDLAAAPYSYYEDNEQYVVALLCVTCGECEINAVLAGETNVDDLPDGVAEWKAYGPADHGQVHGRIGDDFGIWEDMVTSPDVDSLDLRSATQEQKLDIPTEFIAPDTIRLLAAGDRVEAFEAGATIVVSGSASNNGGFTIAAVTKAAGHTDLDVTSGVADEAPTPSLLRAFSNDAIATRNGRQQVWKIAEDPALGTLGLAAGDVVQVTAAGGVDQTGTVVEYSYRPDYTEGETVAGNHTLKLRNPAGGLEVGVFSDFTVYEMSDPPTFDVSGIPRWTGPFRVTKAGQSINRIGLDLVFPAGLYKASPTTGELMEDTAEFRFQCQQIDTDGNPVGDWQTVDYAISTTDVLGSGAGADPLNTPIRLTETIFVGTGEWRIRGRRTNEESAEASDQSRCVWEFLKGQRILRNRPVYGPTTILACRFKISAGLSGKAVGSIRASAQRRLPQIRTPYDGTTLGLSRSPVRALYDICCNPDYGLGLDPAVFLNLSELRAARTLHTGAGLHFDHVFTSQSSAWEAMAIALQPALAKPSIVDGRVTVLQEGPKAARTMMFSPINVLPGTLKVAFGFRNDGDPDGVRIISHQADSLAEVESIFPATSVRPTEQRIYGLTDSAVADDLAKVRWRERARAQTLVELSVRGDGRIPRRGDRVGLSWPTFGWGDACVLVEVDGLDLLLDRPVPDISGGSRWAAIRTETGGVVGPVAMTKTGPRRITLAADPGVELFVLGGAQEPTHIAIGRGSGFLMDLTVEEIAQGDDGGARIRAKGYVESVWDGTVFEALET
ncbi:host specificity factor TipJ family phage tail protein [Albimonas pacifica]|uniref:Tip attachment protein J domain-containing protein n=1 Tax=Albimonas pacifica TaxID=1114924 RepID=A0A1I3HHU8_9RHOB|nr:host specificity factor TipJ family phage tail protein [Albimonas pacifica]SFI35315.1 hypothetical protein SAMN05216258_1064 [Albimonas pacifica]